MTSSCPVRVYTWHALAAANQNMRSPTKCYTVPMSCHTCSGALSTCIFPCHIMGPIFWLAMHAYDLQVRFYACIKRNHMHAHVYVCVCTRMHVSCMYVWGCICEHEQYVVRKSNNVYMHAKMYGWMDVWVCVCMCMQVSMHACVWMNVWLFVCVCLLCLHACECVCACLLMCMCACTCVCVHVTLCVCV